MDTFVISCIPVSESPAELRGRTSVFEGHRTCPPEPKQADREGKTSDNVQRHTPFRYNLSIIREILAPPRWLNERRGDSSKNHAERHSEERQSADTRSEAVNALEDQRISSQEYVEQPVHK